MDYSVEYFYNMLRNYTKTAERICKIRWDFVAEIKPRVVLDYGSGCGFFKAFAPENTVVDTYDIMPVPITGINQHTYDLITFWDVLEHIEWENNPDRKIENILTRTKYVAATVPILPVGKNYKTWKHRKEKEHLTHFKNVDAFIAFFRQRDFKIIKSGAVECPPREDVYSFLFEKI